MNVCIKRALWPAGMISVALLGGCLSISVETPGEPLPPKELQIRTATRQFAAQMSERVQRTADAISAESSDPVIATAALRWKLGTSVTARRTAYRAVPRHALVDTWAFTEQMNLFFSDGAGRATFGPQHARAAEEASRIAKEARALAQENLDPAEFQRYSKLVQEYALSEPLRDLQFVRAPFPLSWVMAGASAPATVGSAQEVAADAAERLNVYGQSIPDEARWRTEIFLADAGIKSGDLARLLARTEETFRRISELAETQPEKVAALLESVRAELNTAHRDLTGAWTQIDLRWGETLKMLQGERAELVRTLETMQGAMDATLQRERAAFYTAFTREREAFAADAERFTLRLTEQAHGLVREAVAWFYGTLVLVLGTTFLIGFFLGRATQRRRTGAPGAGSLEARG